jgi:hypothetical protein
MKKLFFLLIWLFFWFTSSLQSCLPQGITFSTQAQIDSFHTNYPNCTQIEGDVTISGNDITNLNGLSVLTYIGGYLEINSNPALTSLSGLDNITSFGNDLYIEYNNLLTNLSGLDNVTSIGTDLSIVDNNNLGSLTGLNSLISIGGMLYVQGTNAFTNFSGLDNLTTIGDALWIGYTTTLTNFTGLNKVTFIGGDIDIYNNDALTNFTGLSSLTSIGEGIDIEYNVNALTSLTGLDNIADSSIKGIYFFYNLHLCTCSIKSICNYLNSPNELTVIESNANGCNSIQEVKDSCIVFSIKDTSSQQMFSIFPNPSVNKLTIQTSLDGQLSISNLNGQELITRQITEPKTQIDVSALPSGVYFVRLTNDRTVSMGKIIKQ